MLKSRTARQDRLHYWKSLQLQNTQGIQDASTSTNHARQHGQLNYSAEIIFTELCSVQSNTCIHIHIHSAYTDADADADAYTYTDADACAYTDTYGYAYTVASAFTWHICIRTHIHDAYACAYA